MRPGGLPLLSAGDVADMHFDAAAGGAQVDCGPGRKILYFVARRSLLPFFFGHVRVGFRFFHDQLLNGFNHGVRIFPGRHRHYQFIPEPLAGSREIEVVAFDGEAVDERDFAAGGMPGVSPVAGFEQRRAEQADLHNFAADTIDLDPVADANAVASHQHEPADEADDEVFQRHREAGAGQPEHCRGLAWHAEYDEDNEQKSDRLHGKPDHRAQANEPPLLGGEVDEIAVDQPAREVDDQADQKNPEHRLQHAARRPA